jgi:small nuclear ribonucleoprotein (snRNP)-like protein
MRVSIIDGRVLVGVLLCTDRDRNLILGNCNEYIGSPSEQEEFRVLGLALIPGQHIQSIYIDESSTSITKSNDQILDDDKSDG